MRDLLPLKKYFVRYKKYLILGFLFILLANFFAILLPPIVRKAIDGIIQMSKDGMQPEFSYVPDYFNTESKVAIYVGLLILAFALLKGVSMFFMRMTIIIMSRHIEYDQKNDIFKQYQHLGQSFYSKNYTGDLMNRISDDVSKVRMFTGPAIMYSLNLSCMILMVVSLMFYVNAQITMYVLIPLPILALTIYMVSDAMNKKSDLIQQKLSTITSFVQETFSGIQVVKSYATENNFSNYFSSMNESYKEDNMSLVKINGIFMPAVVGLVGLSILITIYVGGNAVVRGEFSLGNVVEYVIYVTMLTWPVASLGYVTSLVQRGAASQKRINNFMDEAPDPDQGTMSLNQLKKGISFENVWFRYGEKEPWVLQDISFDIDAKSKFGIIGTTGSGKSTIAKLIMGVYMPVKGKILIDDRPIEEYTKASLREKVGYVDQDIFLFSETLEDNILFGRNTNTDSKNLLGAIHTADLDNEISSFPEGLQTVLGERGITLSGGQKQRTAIARALVKKPEILLIDDGLSAVDTKTEVNIKTRISEWSDNQTFINISHRISSVQDSQYIIYLDGGKIVEQGNHSALINLKKNVLPAIS